jgi:hypothetical protein
VTDKAKHTAYYNTESITIVKRFCNIVPVFCFCIQSVNLISFDYLNKKLVKNGLLQFWEEGDTTISNCSKELEAFVNCLTEKVF